jgi:hypothetical protein
MRTVYATTHHMENGMERNGVGSSPSPSIVERTKYPNLYSSGTLDAPPWAMHLPVVCQALHSLSGHRQLVLTVYK